MKNFKPHKIPGVEKSVCCAEQKIADNLLFMWAKGSTGNEKTYSLSCIQNQLAREKDTTFKRFDIDLVYHYILQSWDRYRNAECYIFTSYEDLASVIYSDCFKAE